MPLPTDPRIGHPPMPSDEQLLAQLRKLQRCVPRFQGVLFDAERKQWRAAIRYNGKAVIIGHYDSEVLAFQAYRNARPQRTDAWESPAKIERLLRLAESCPHEIRQDSLMRSSLDQSRWAYEHRSYRKGSGSE